MIIMRYKLTIKPEPEFEHETFEQRKARILKVTQGITITYVFIIARCLCYIADHDLIQTCSCAVGSDKEGLTVVLLYGIRPLAVIILLFDCL